MSNKLFSDKRWNDNPCAIFPQCNSCKHWHTGTATCEAYPEKIPLDILKNRVIHDKPFSGDKGILFEKKDD